MPSWIMGSKLMSRRGFLQRTGGLLLAGGGASAAGRMEKMSEARQPPEARGTTLFLCGDVMTGRGIDQVLPHPGNPALHEAYATSALDYVALAERAHGPIPRTGDFAYPWGDALAAWARVRPDVRIANLETAVTTREDW